jgi:hypothetical protein
MDKYKQKEDAEEAIKNYNQSAKKQENDLRAKGVAEKMVLRKNVLDSLDEDFKNAGQTEYERKIFGK